MREKLRFPVKRALPMLAVASCALSITMGAHAQTVDCSGLSSHVIYVAGSTAVQPFLATIGKNLAALNPPIYVVYQGQGSCVGVGALANPDDTTKNSITGTATYWDTTGAALTCNLAAITGNVVDIGVSDVFAASCGQTPPSTVKDFHGPVQAMTFAVPVTSTQTSISAEAAYMVFGFGADSAAHTILPWNDATALEVRSASSGTQQMISAALAQVGSGFTASKFKGVSNSGSGGVLTGLTTLASGGNAEKAVGILSADFMDKNRASVKELYYQHVGQGCGYLPDSSPTAFDKQNVRDGHYAVWGPLHMLARVDTAGKANNPDVKTVLDILTGAVEPSFDLLSVEAKGGVVPDCAMRVMRTSEVGPMASYMPDKSCECKFVAAATGTAPTGCKTCTKANEATDCTSAAPHCNYGYCEL